MSLSYANLAIIYSAVLAHFVLLVAGVEDSRNEGEAAQRFQVGQ